MIIKLIFVFLGAMAVLAMLGNLLFPGALQRGIKRRMGSGKPAICKSCGRHILGTAGCDCKKG